MLLCPPQTSGFSPFGFLPVLETPAGGPKIAQSVAIANYIAKRAGAVLGEDGSDGEYALSQMCLAEGEDLYALLLAKKLPRWQLLADRLSEEELEPFYAEELPGHFANLEQLWCPPTPRRHEPPYIHAHAHTNTRTRTTRIARAHTASWLTVSAPTVAASTAQRRPTRVCLLRPDSRRDLPLQDGLPDRPHAASRLGNVHERFMNRS